jgi:RteC protein
METQDVKTFSDQLQQKLKGQLEVIGLETADSIAVVSKSLQTIKVCLIELKEFVRDYPFMEKQEEIQFFKEIKPIFMSQYYYHEKTLSIKLNEPIGDREDTLRYFYHELKVIQDFKNENCEFYKYCLTNSNHLDDKYFSREGYHNTNPNEDERFSTGYDNTLALLLANQMLKDYLQSAIKKASVESNDERALLTWTGPKTYLIELVYALQSAETLNNGKTDIKQIASAFENIFNISLGNYYRVFQEIQQRKKGKSYFLDQLKAKFIQRVNEFDQH